MEDAKTIQQPVDINKLFADGVSDEDIAKQTDKKLEEVQGLRTEFEFQNMVKEAMDKWEIPALSQKFTHLNLQKVPLLFNSVLTYGLGPLIKDCYLAGARDVIAQGLKEQMKEEEVGTPVVAEGVKKNPEGIKVIVGSPEEKETTTETTESNA